MNYEEKYKNLVQEITNTTKEKSTYFRRFSSRLYAPNTSYSRKARRTSTRSDT